MNIVYVALVICKWVVLIALGIALVIGFMWLSARFWGVLVIGGGIAALFGYIFAWQVVENYGLQAAGWGAIAGFLGAAIGMNDDPDLGTRRRSRR
jgi:hypothetical protein